MKLSRRRRDDEAALQDAEREVVAARKDLSAAGMTDGSEVADGKLASARRHSFTAVAQLRQAEAANRKVRNSRPERRRGFAPSRASLAWIAGFAAAAVAIGVFVLPGSTPAAVAAGPPPLTFSQVSVSSDLASVPSAGPQLMSLADLAEDQLGPSPSEGYEISSSEWALAFQSDAKDPQAAVVPFNTIITVSPDGAAQRLQRRGEPLTPDGRGAAFDTADLLGPAVQTDALPAGSIDVQLIDRLPRQPDQLRGMLLGERGCPEDLSTSDLPAGSYGVGCLVGALTDLYAYHVVPSDLQSAIWRMLAEDPAFKWAGTGSDRAGRSCVAVVVDETTDDVTQRWIFMIDGKTGRLLGIDDLLTGGQVGGVQAPAVLNFIAYL